MLRKLPRRRLRGWRRVINRAGLGSTIGLIGGLLQIYATSSKRSYPAWMILVTWIAGSAAFSVIADCWLNRFEVEVEEQPDPTGMLGKVVGFLFGAVFGFFFAIGLLPRLLSPTNWEEVKVVIPMCVLFFGFLSAKYGNDFWQGMSER